MAHVGHAVLRTRLRAESRSARGAAVIVLVCVVSCFGGTSADQVGESIMVQQENS